MNGWSDDRFGLELDSFGRPGVPVRRIDLEPWYAADADSLARAAATVRDALPLTIGIATGTPPVGVAPLLEALSLTLAGPGAADNDPRLIAVPDPEAAYADLVSQITRRPRSSIALGQLVRQTSATTTTAGLAAEAAVYSMLLGGPEFASWLAETKRPAPAEAERDTVRIAREGSCLSLSLDRSERRNALSFGMREELFSALELAVLDTGIDRVELTGVGPVFCSGGDLAEFGTADDFVAAYLVRLDRAPWRLLDALNTRLGKNLSVRVQGAAIGAGIEMAAFSGHLSCAHDAYFQLPEIEMGLVPGAGGTVSVVRRIGRWRAAWAILSGARIDAETALAWGLVDEVEA